ARQFRPELERLDGPPARRARAGPRRLRRRARPAGRPVAVPPRLGPARSRARPLAPGPVGGGPASVDEARRKRPRLPRPRGPVLARRVPGSARPVWPRGRPARALREGRAAAGAALHGAPASRLVARPRRPPRRGGEG